MRGIRVLFTLSLLALLIACAQVARITNITVDPVEESILVGETMQLTAEVEGDNEPDLGVTWSSSDAATAKVGTDGDVTGIASGTATITATSVFDTDWSADATIHVADVLIELDQRSLDLEIGEVVVVTATVRGSTDTRVTWRSSDPAVASVTDAGVVTAVGAGSTTVTAACVADPAVKASLSVTIARPAEPNDTPRTATPIELDYVSPELMITLGDLDYFTFTLPEARSVLAQVNAQELGSTLDATLRLFDDSGLIAENDDHCGAGYCTADPLLLGDLDAGTYYLEVRGYMGISTGWYNLAVEVYTGAIPAVDTEWLYFGVTEGTTAEATFTLSNSGEGAFAFTIAEAAYITFWPDSGVVPPGGSVEITVGCDASLLSAPDWIYTEAVVTTDSPLTPELWIGIEVQIVGPPDQYEPNDSLTEATPITLDFVSPELAITPSDDDYFVFSLGETRTVTADVDASEIGSTLDPMLGLFDASGNTIEINDDYHGLDSWIERTLDAGTYYLAVTGCCGFGSHGQNGFYVLNVTATP